MSATAARKRVSVLAWVLLCAAGCASSPHLQEARTQPPGAVTAAPASSTNSDRLARSRSTGERAAYIASRQVGVPYRYGGSGRSGFDCSGLVHYAYGQLGIALPRTTAALWRSLAPITGDALAAGDVLFFNIDGKASHVGVYLGDGRFVHAPSSGRRVAVARLDRGFYRDSFIRAGRP